MLAQSIKASITKYTHSTSKSPSFIRNLSSNAVKAQFHPFDDLETWLSKQPLQAIKSQFETQGFAVIYNIIDSRNLSIYRDFYDQMLNGDINANAHRHDLGNNEDRHLNDMENVTQIMWPSEYISNLQTEGPFHPRALALSQFLLSNDSDFKYSNHSKQSINSIESKESLNCNPIIFDFDMMIYKHAHSVTDVPWHQDAAYWPFAKDMDLNACSFWCAMDDAHIDNGCMWFLPRTRQQLEHQFEHHPVKEDCHILTIRDEEFNRELAEFDGGIAVPIPSGSCTIHNGRTPHFTKGNTTNSARRALIACYRYVVCVVTHYFQVFRISMFFQ